MQGEVQETLTGSVTTKDEAVLRGWTYYVTTCILTSDRDGSPQHGSVNKIEPNTMKLGKG